MEHAIVIITCSVIGGVGLIVVLIAVIICCYRKCTRYDYTPLIEDLALPSKLKRERREERDKIREEALLNCQFYLRSHTGKYAYMGYLPNMGTRLEKHWFLVRKIRKTKDLIMNIWSKDTNCPIPFNSSSQKTLREIFVAIKHPYIWPVLDLDLWDEQGLVISVQTYHSRGSLKDHIYGVNPNQYVEDKYGMPGRPLPIKEVKVYGLHILQALLYLEEQGFPFHGHLHSGNVILDKRKCKLAAYENAFLGYSSKLFSVLSKYCRDDMPSFDSLSFGHLMFEMGSGEELNQAFPDRTMLKRCKQKGVVELLEFIFDVNGSYPSIRDISEHEFFVGIRLKELEESHPAIIHVTPAMKTIFKSVKKGKRASSKTKNHGRQKKVQSYGSVQSITPLQTSTPPDGTPPIVPPVPPPPPGAPAAAPPPPVVPKAGPSKTNLLPEVDTGRSTLLGDICKGISLRKLEDPQV